MNNIKSLTLSYIIPGANLPIKVTIEFDADIHTYPSNIPKTIEQITGCAHMEIVTILDMGASFVAFIHGVPDLIFNSHISPLGYFKITTEIFPNQTNLPNSP